MNEWPFFLPLWFSQVLTPSLTAFEMVLVGEPLVKMWWWSSSRSWFDIIPQIIPCSRRLRLFCCTGFSVGTCENHEISTFFVKLGYSCVVWHACYGLASWILHRMLTMIIVITRMVITSALSDTILTANGNGQIKHDSKLSCWGGIACKKWIRVFICNCT